MRNFKYGHEESSPLNVGDLYVFFNNYRIFKHLIAALISLKKTQLDKYKIFEPGCGDGDKLRFFTQFRAKPENCYGLDINETAVNLCKILSPSTMNFQVGSALDLPFENNMFDIILCSGLFDCFNDDGDIRKISMELKRVIKNDGIVFVIDINENFNQVYGKNAEVMKKNLRSFDTKKGELEHLLSSEFHLSGQMYLFGSDIYFVNDGLAQLIHLPLIEIQLDREELTSAYSFWVFLNNE